MNTNNTTKIFSDKPIIVDVNSALDVMANSDGNIIINKEAFCLDVH